VNGYESALHEQLAALDTPEEDRAGAGRRLKTVAQTLQDRLTAWEGAGIQRDALVAQIDADG